ncbi:MAG TPA: hypothetical protein VFN97_11115 [Actinospica sp.]|nr:hypothetical protein [Actinospica sp.]
MDATCPAVVCLNGPNVLVTGRGPADMSEFCDAVVEQVTRGAGRPSDAGAR